MKNNIIISLLFLSITGLLGAQNRQEDSASVYRSIIPVEKQSLMKNIDVIFNTQIAFRSDFLNSEYLRSVFRMEQFRLEIKGYVHKNIYFRFRHRYTSTFEPQTVDKIIKGVDFAFVRFDIKEKWQLTIGKMWADWGGIEFDLNPIYVYEYSDIIEQADNFLTGVGIYYQLNKIHGLSFQILDSRTSTFEEIYDSVPNVQPSKAPLAMVFNWRGNFWDGKFSTLWSFSYFTEAKGFGKNYIALGNLFQSGRWYAAYDYKISIEDLDRTGIISNDIPDNLYNYSVENTLYQSHWIRVKYQFAKKWKIALDAWVDLAYWRDDLDPLKTENKFRTAYGYVPTVEFHPWDDYILYFFVGYVGRIYNYSNYAKTRPGLELKDYTTGRVMIGLVSPIHVM